MRAYVRAERESLRGSIQRERSERRAEPSIQAPEYGPASLSKKRRSERKNHKAHKDHKTKRFFFMCFVFFVVPYVRRTIEFVTGRGRTQSIRVWFASARPCPGSASSPPPGLCT